MKGKKIIVSNGIVKIKSTCRIIIRSSKIQSFSKVVEVNKFLWNKKIRFWSVVTVVTRE